MKRHAAAATMLLVSVIVSRCALNSPVAEDYYSGTEKIAGGKPPSAPVLTFTKASLRVDYTAAIDPDTSAEVPTYYIYLYAGLPSTYYQARDIDNVLNAPTQRTFYLPGLAGATGTYTVVLTGYDGYRESAVTDQNKITFTLP